MKYIIICRVPNESGNKNQFSYIDVVTEYKDLEHAHSIYSGILKDKNLKIISVKLACILEQG